MGTNNLITNLTSLVAATNDIRDIKPPVDIPNPWLWVWWALIAVALLAIAALVWRWFKKRQTERPGPPPVPPHVWAREKLDEALGLIGEPKVFVSSVSNTLRVYIECAFSLRAPERTTEEFLTELQYTSEFSDAQKSSLTGFLKQCDMVKFARYEPGEPELRELHALALGFVVETEPREGEPEGPPAPTPPAGSQAA